MILTLTIFIFLLKVNVDFYFKIYKSEIYLNYINITLFKLYSFNFI